MNEPTHGEKRIGLLTSSVAHIIMHGSEKAWESYRTALWAADGTEFAANYGGAREYGHAHEAEGAAKFWERHNDTELTGDIQAPFYLYRSPHSTLDQWLASSPDRVVLDAWGNGIRGGLEIKSPTSPETFDIHTKRKHYDQCQHGLLVTKFPQWWLVVHHGDLYKEFHLLPDKEWQDRYLERAEKFLAYTYEDKPVVRRKLSITDLGI